LEFNNQENDIVTIENNHPFIATQDSENGNCFQIRTSYRTAGEQPPIEDELPRLSVVLERLSQDDGRPFDSLYDAEAAILATLSGPTKAAPEVAPSDDSRFNAIWINRHANIIAVRTRRGAANVVLMNEADTDRVASFIRIDPPQVANGWTEIGTLDHHMRVFAPTSGHANPIPEGEVIVAYKGENPMDAAAIFATYPAGARLHIQDENSQEMSFFQNYMMRVSLV
jgi:hypothetical protein